MLDTLRSFFAPPISADPEQSTAKIIWLVRLRWIALTAQLLSIPPALYFQVLEPPMLPYFVGIIGLLASLNFATWRALRRGSSTGRRQVLLQLGADVAALSGLLALTGGAWNPVAPILFVHAVLGSLLLEGRQSIFFFALLVACLVTIQLVSNIPIGLQGSLVPYQILFPAQLLFALVFWILTAWLSRTLTSLQSHFGAQRERKTRIDRLRAVGALAAGLSHEFATPLNAAQLRLKRLGRRHELEGDADLRTAVEALHRCGEVLRRMAGSQLRPEGLSLEPTDVDTLVQRVCESVSQANEGARIKFVAAGRSPRRVLLPSVAFSQAVLNLIDNALQAGGPNQPVEVVVGSDRGRVEVAVLDRGEGWPEVVRKHLGEPFITTRPDGIGLGLYYVHTLVEALGAELYLEDRDSGGASARISMIALPLATAAGPSSDPETAAVEVPA